MSKFCPHCGKENNDDRTFCYNCGKPLSDPSVKADAVQGPQNNIAENKIGKALKAIGALVIIVGIIISVIFGVSALSILVIGAVASFISGMIFIGFGEIIILLQRSVDEQKNIVQKLNDIDNDKTH